jgi:multiple sugar transport system substrate-binding protein
MLSHSEEYLKRVNLVQPTHELFESETFKNMPYSDVFKTDLEHATLTYYSANSSAILEKMKQAVEAVMLQNQDPESVLKNFRRQVQSILDEE